MTDKTVLDEIQRQIDSGLIQGAAVRTNRNDETIALGIQAGAIPMTARSRFDIASTGKVFTAACVALLALDGKIDLDAPFTEYLPDHALGKDCTITVRDLAAHASGFDNDKPYCSADHTEFMRKLYAWMPKDPRRTTCTYSCGNYVLLGKIAEKVSGTDLDSLARKLLWEPLGMTHTTWLAPGAGPHEVQHHHPTREPGVHNDETCYLADVPLGNGSAFSTADDMFLFLNDIIQRNVFPAAYYDLILKPDFNAGGEIRSFGWDMSPDGRPEGLSEQTIHHTGWTGQSLFADPVTGICGAVLTSRTGDWGLAKEGRKRIMELIIQNSK